MSEVMGQIVIMLILIALVIGAVGYVVWTIKSRASRKREFEAGVLRLENSLTSKGFVISHKVGCHHTPSFYAESIKYGQLSDSSLYLYVDDVNKKWLITAPAHKNPDMTFRRFENLLGFDFFDAEDESAIANLSNSMNKILKGTLTTGGALGGGLGGALGGVQMGNFLTRDSADGATVAYGIVCQTTDCTAANPVIRFDFMTTRDEPVNKLDKPLFRQLSRTSTKYNQDIRIMQEMAEVLEYILRSNSK